MYIATTCIVIRTQKPLLALPVPKFIATLLDKIFPKSAQPEQKPDTPAQAPEQQSANLQNNDMDKIPPELRYAFMRAKSRPNRIDMPICNVCSITPSIYKNESPEPSTPSINNDLPLPPDFEFDDSYTPSPNAPVFQDIDLYDTNDTILPNTPEDNTNDSPNPVTEHFTKTNQEFTVVGSDIILTPHTAIAIHNDPEFWIMDDDMWFASGKTRQSPIPELLNIATQHNVKAVLYLGSTNIMDFDSKCADWQSQGIKIVTKLEDL